MNRTIGLILAVALASGALGYVVSRQTGTAPQTTPVEGQPLPPFSFIDLAGMPLTHEQFADSPLIINLWATWCGPCLEEMPLLSQLAEELKPQGLKMLGIALDEPGLVAKFLAETPVSYPIAIAETMQGMRYARALGNGRGMLPYTVFVDRDGRVKRIKIGQLSARQAMEFAGEIL